MSASIAQLRVFVEANRGAQYMIDGDDLRELLAEHKRLSALMLVPEDVAAVIRDEASDMSVDPAIVLRAMVSMATREDRDQELVCEVEDELMSRAKEVMP